MVIWCWGATKPTMLLLSHKEFPDSWIRKLWGGGKMEHGWDLALSLPRHPSSTLLSRGSSVIDSLPPIPPKLDTVGPQTPLSTDTSMGKTSTTGAAWYTSAGLASAWSACPCASASRIITGRARPLSVCVSMSATLPSHGAESTRTSSLYLLIRLAKGFVYSFPPKDTVTASISSGLCAVINYWFYYDFLWLTFFVASVLPFLFVFQFVCELCCTHAYTLSKWQAYTNKLTHFQSLILCYFF